MRQRPFAGTGDDAGIRWKRLAALIGAVCSMTATATAETCGHEPTAALATMLNIARSVNGRDFEPSGEVFLRYASAPSLTLLPNGDVLALFDYAGIDGRQKHSTLAASKSKDGGRTWSSLRPIALRGKNVGSTHPRHGRAILLNDRNLLLFFSDRTPASASQKPGERSRVTLRAAIGNNGFDYRLISRPVLRLGSPADAYPMPVLAGDQIHLFATALRLAPHAKQKCQRSLVHAVSKNKGPFLTIGRPKVPNVRFIGDILPNGNGFTAFVSSESGIQTLESVDGEIWVEQPGVRIGEGSEPAVVKCSDGTFLMLYSVPVDQDGAVSAEMVRIPLPHEIPFNDETASAAYEGEEPEQGDELAVFEGGALAEVEDVDGISSSDETAHGTATLQGENTPVVPKDDGAFVQKPDFLRHMDYFEWYRLRALAATTDNAYFAYATFMPDPYDEPGSKPELPECSNLLHSDYSGPPGPWLPDEHPDWEACHLEVQGVLAKFHQASLHDGYAFPVLPAPRKVDGLPDAERLLLSIELPQLAPHRYLAKATLADAWRLENGRVSADRMIQAWETVFRAATHMAQGSTLIEDLVATAERNLVQESARWALKEGVFGPKDLERALETLRRFDRPDSNPPFDISGEHAFALDLTQYLFSPPTRDGQPQVNRERAKAVAGGVFNNPDWADRLAPMTPGEVRATIDAFDSYFRELAEQMKIGYPHVRASDLDALHEQYLPASPLTEEFIPGLSRYYQLHTRNETSRRATQLSYETYLFRARHGRWPDSLDELPLGWGSAERTDPFSGEDFGYRMTDEGPVIYSWSENGIDDGGIHSPRWGDGATQDSELEHHRSDDFVFWPPVPRN